MIALKVCASVGLGALWCGGWWLVGALVYWKWREYDA